MLIYAACLKLWFFAALVAALVVPCWPFWAGTGLAGFRHHGCRHSGGDS